MAEQIGEAGYFGQWQGLFNFVDRMVVIPDGIGEEGGKAPLFAEPGASLAMVDMELLVFKKGEPAVMATHAFQQERRIFARKRHPHEQLADVMEKSCQIGLRWIGIGGGRGDFLGKEGVEIGMVPEPVDGQQAIGFYPAENLLNRNADTQISDGIHPEVHDRLFNTGEGLAGSDKG